jgi:hypothetical protein
MTYCALPDATADRIQKDPRFKEPSKKNAGQRGITLPVCAHQQVVNNLSLVEELALTGDFS